MGLKKVVFFNLSFSTSKRLFDDLFYIFSHFWTASDFDLSLTTHFHNQSAVINFTNFNNETVADRMIIANIIH